MRERRGAPKTHSGYVGHCALQRERVLDGGGAEPGNNGGSFPEGAVRVPGHVHAQADTRRCRQGRRDASQPRPVDLSDDRSYGPKPAGSLFQSGLQEHHQLRATLLAACEVPGPCCPGRLWRDGHCARLHRAARPPVQREPDCDLARPAGGRRPRQRALDEGRAHELGPEAPRPSPGTPPPCGRPATRRGTLRADLALQARVEAPACDVGHAIEALGHGRRLEAPRAHTHDPQQAPPATREVRPVPGHLQRPEAPPAGGGRGQLEGRQARRDHPPAHQGLPAQAPAQKRAGGERRPDHRQAGPAPLQGLLRPDSLDAQARPAPRPLR